MAHAHGLLDHFYMFHWNSCLGSTTHHPMKENIRCFNKINTNRSGWSMVIVSSIISGTVEYFPQMLTYVGEFRML